MAQEGAIPLEEAAVRLGKTPNALRKQAAKNTITAYKQGGRWYVVWPIPVPKQAPQTSLAKVSETSPNKPADGEVTYLRAALERAMQQLSEERRRYDEALAAEAARRDAMIAAIGQLTTTLERVPQLTAGTVEPEARRPWWQFWRR